MFHGGARLSEHVVVGQVASPCTDPLLAVSSDARVTAGSGCSLCVRVCMGARASLPQPPTHPNLQRCPTCSQEILKHMHPKFYPHP